MVLGLLSPSRSRPHHSCPHARTMSSPKHPHPGPVPAPFSADPFSGGPLFLESLSGTRPPCLATEEIERTLQPERDSQNDGARGSHDGAGPAEAADLGSMGISEALQDKGHCHGGALPLRKGRGVQGAATCSGEGWLAATRQDSASHAQRPGSPAGLAPWFAELPGEGLSVMPAPITSRWHPQLSFISLGAPARPSVRGPLQEAT